MDLLQYKAHAPFSQRHLLCLQDYTPDEILQVLSLAAKLKKAKKEGVSPTPLAGKKMAMIFTKPSLRTRVTFEVGCVELGGYTFMLSKDEIGLGQRESVQDVARVLSRVCDGIMIRTFAQSDVEGLARHGSIPVINGLSDDYHPCQVLADMLTLQEKTGGFKGKKLAFIGDGNNMANSLMIVCTKLGVDIAIGCPKGYEPSEKVLGWAQENAKASGSEVLITNDPVAAVESADAVYTDVWASMGQKDQAAKRRADFEGFQVDEALMRAAASEAIFLHCLPAVRGEEVTDQVMESPRSFVFDQAENRLHAQKAVMALLMGGEVSL